MRGRLNRSRPRAAVSGISRSALRAPLGLGAGGVEGGGDGPLPGGRDDGAPNRAEGPKVRAQLAAVLESGSALAGAQLVALSDVRYRTLDQPERDAVRALEAHGLDC